MISAALLNPITSHAAVGMIGLALGAILGALGIAVMLAKACPSHPGDAIDKETRRKT